LRDNTAHTDVIGLFFDSGEYTIPVGDYFFPGYEMDKEAIEIITKIVKLRIRPGGNPIVDNHLVALHQVVKTKIELKK